jgi:O-antigen/teichoic acid export membrane protein
MINKLPILFKNISTGQTIIKNSFWLTLSEVLSRLIKIVLIIYAARILGTSGYGVFSYVLSTTGLITVTADIGITTFLTRQISRERKVNAAYIATAFAMKLVFVVIGALILIIAVPLITKIEGVVALIPFMILLVLFDCIRDIVLAIVRGREIMQSEAGIYIFTNAVIVALGLFAIFYFRSSASLIIAYTIGNFIGSSVAFLLYKKYFVNIWRYFNRGLIKQIFVESWPYALLSLLGVIMMNTDIIMLGSLGEASDVGLYSAAYKPVDIMYVIPGIFVSALLPAMSRMVKEQNKKLRNTLEKSISTMFLMGLPIVAGGIILSQNIINFLFGSQYIEAVLTFKILLLTVLIVFPGLVISHTIFAYNKQKSFIGFLLFGVIANILLNAIFIPKYGIVGSAIATVCALFIANSFVWAKMKKISYFVILPHIKKILLATAVMSLITAVAQSSGFNMFINIILSAALYFLILKTMKEPLLGNFREIIKI